MPDGSSPRPLIVPVFIPNQGCPYRCVYCHQEGITGKGGSAPSSAEVEEILRLAVQSPNFRLDRNPEIAFYGGTFTGLPSATMEALLRAAHDWVAGGPFQGVRVSTRPDALDEERLSVMRRYGVATVELGVQSMDDEVLRRSLRGYTSEKVEEAVEGLRRFGFRVGIQLMPGLPGDSDIRFLDTVNRCLALRPNLVRLYPTVVLEGTRLAAWYRKGRYLPMSLEGAVALCAEACVRFESKDIPVIRIGLLASNELLDKGGLLAGPWHPAFGFLVRSSMYHRKIDDLLPKPMAKKGLRISAHPRDVPLVRGYRNRGLRAVAEKTGAEVLQIRPDNGLSPGAPVVETFCTADGPA